MKDCFCYKVPGISELFYVSFLNSQCYSNFTSYCVIRIYKRNPHSYDLRVFFYGSKNIFCYNRLTSKKEVVDYIKFLISLEKESVSNV